MNMALQEHVLPAAIMTVLLLTESHTIVGSLNSILNHERRINRVGQISLFIDS